MRVVVVVPSLKEDVRLEQVDTHAEPCADLPEGQSAHVLEVEPGAEVCPGGQKPASPMARVAQSLAEITG